jgi:hypothetical protein
MNLAIQEGMSGLVLKGRSGRAMISRLAWALYGVWKRSRSYWRDVAEKHGLPTAQRVAI